jgi:hypothetical protein
MPIYKIWQRGVAFISNRSYLIGFVEEETEVSEDDPQFLPAVAVLELAQQEAAQLVLQFKSPD